MIIWAVPSSRFAAYAQQMAKCLILLGCRLHTACGRCILLSYGDIFRYLIHFSGFQDCCQEIHTLFPSTEFLFFLFTEAFFSDIIN